MPIKWSAVKVSEAMDEVERQINLAEVFFIEASTRAREARSIANLPGYLDNRLIRLITAIERINNANSTLKAVRNAIPEGAIKVEREQTKHGTTQSLI